ncbi:helix-turn-helix transcriptional regulator [Streptomyces sp. H27-H5]|uniref:helix-turn-helix transcriptional regulator n=1 Tax=Streptomyces sp. H27-H5 TaxID=2996460 RepID=UPI0022717BC1|nr:helix-turn-helix transcriptional regulator [Streptomyces sp. H27-H5]MCY0961538.1 helix-turn-helix transcriptional regulator [Streptomyces sp. H27-H5]
MTNYDAEDQGVREILQREEELESWVDDGDGAEVAPDDSPMSFVDSESLASHNLKIIRRHLGVSQQQIAERLPEVSGGTVRLAQTQIAKIERGERPWRVNEMFAIAAALGVSWSELFQGGVREGETEEERDRLLMLGARLKYQQAQAKVDELRRGLEAAKAEAAQAGRAMVRTSVELEIADPDVLHFLSMSHASRRHLAEDEERVRELWRSEEFDVVERIRESEEQAKIEWQRLVADLKVERQRDDAVE